MDWFANCSKKGVRTFIIVLIIAGLGYLFLVQKQHQASPEAKPPGIESNTTPELLTPAPRGQASKYNFMKRALDRAADVRDQARARTQDAQNP